MSHTDEILFEKNHTLDGRSILTIKVVLRKDDGLEHLAIISSMTGSVSLKLMNNDLMPQALELVEKKFPDKNVSLIVDLKASTSNSVDFDIAVDSKIKKIEKSSDVIKKLKEIDQLYLVNSSKSFATAAFVQVLLKTVLGKNPKKFDSLSAAWDDIFLTGDN
jgi:hypothetical protein